MMPLDAQIESVLFYKTDALNIGKLCSLLNTDRESVLEALNLLETKLNGRGVSLTRVGEEVMLTTGKDASALVEKISKDELEGELSKASVETLSIILYRGKATKGEIDYIRGVNSGFILRALLIRGLVDRIHNHKDGRAFVYKPTVDLYNYLGISNKEELPNYTALIGELDKLNNQTEESIVENI